MIRQHRCGTWAAATGLWVGLCVASVAAAGVQYNAVILAGGPGYEQGGAKAYAIADGMQLGYSYLSNGGSRVLAGTAWSSTPGSAAYLDGNGSAALVRGGGSGQLVGWNFGAYEREHALVWASASASPVDLNPDGFYRSFAYAAAGGQQVGYGKRSLDNAPRALLWNGTAASAVDLTPAGANGAYAYGTTGYQQVGVVEMSYRSRAYLWTGDALSGVDLHPAGFAFSWARATTGSTQVGYGMSGGSKALLWRGTAESVVSLHPAGYEQSWALAAAGDWQVGSGYNASFKPAWLDSRGDKTETGFVTHALLWSGTPESAVDLHAFLPSDYVGSEALGVDAQGNVVGVGYTLGTYDASPVLLAHAVLWTPVPEPMSCGLVLVAAAGSVACGRRRVPS